MQYTIRGVPETVDAALRERARAAGKSLNEVAIEALAEGVGVAGAPTKRRNFEHIAGTWKEDKAFDEAIADQRRIDEDLWK
jgi:plasmid stability protein